MNYKKRKSIMKILLLPLCLVLLLTACSSAKSSTEKNSEASAPTTEQTQNKNALEKNAMKIKVTDGKNTVVFELNNTPSAKSFYNMLPFDSSVKNYSDNEKIFDPKKKIDTANGLEGNCPTGTLALFSPWGNVVMFYGPAPAYPGLYLLGKAVDGIEKIKNFSGTIHVEAAK